MNVVWDFGAVLFRWRPAVLLARLLPAQALEAQSAERWAGEFFGGFGGDWSQFDRGAIEVPVLVERIARRTGLAPADVAAVIAAVPEELEPIDANVALLAALRERGHRQFFLSNMPAPYADHLEAAYRFVRGFDGGLFSGRVKLIKPEAEFFAMAEAHFGLEPAATLFFDDQPDNVEAARARGWQAVHVTHPGVVEPALRRLGLL